MSINDLCVKWFVPGFFKFCCKFKMKIILLIFFCGQLLFSQDIKYLENAVQNLSGDQKTEYLLKIADYYLKREPSKSLSAAKRALENSEISNSKTDIGRSYFALGEYHYLQGNNNQAEKYFEEAGNYFYPGGNRKLLAVAYSKQSVVKRILGEFDNALEVSLKSLEINRNLKDTSAISENYNELGLIYRNLGETKKAIIFFKDALTFAQQTNNLTELKRAYNYIGNHYFFEGEIDKAEHYYLKANAYYSNDKIEDDFYAGILNNLGNCRREKKDFTKAMEYYQKSLIITQRLGDKNLIVVIYKNIGITKKRQNDFTQAHKYLSIADSLSKLIGLKRFNRDILLEISKLYKQENKFKEALEYHILYSAINDSIFNQDITNKVKLFESRFEKQKAQELVTSDKLSQEIYFRNLLIVFLILAIITLAMLYYIYRSNKLSNKKINRQKEELQHLNKSLEEKNQQLEEFEGFVNRTKAIFIVWQTGSLNPIKFISKNVKTQLGYKDKDFIDGIINWNDLMHPDDVERVKNEHDEFLRNRVLEYSLQYRMINSDGEYRWFEDHNKLIIDRSSNIAYLQAVVLDINERKELEQQLIDYTDELQELNKIKDKFFSIVAHDLKSPFLGLLGLSNILADDFESIEKNQQQEYILEMNKLIKRVYKLIENLLDWSRIQLHKYEVRLKVVNLRDLCENIIEVIKINAQQKNIIIENLLPVDLIMSSDEKMLNSMFSNLISNAIKFTKENGKVKIHCSFNHEKVDLVVEDNGVGIPEEDIENIFKVDQKLSTTGTAGEKGTGLGLIITKELTEKLGGSIHAESKLDEYTKFIVSLPYKEGEFADQQKPDFSVKS